ncbi:aminotransferase-like domain-containing protein [Parachitinimonas caeni]|uniref:Putative 8-amino-7-oxononanoate synthase n=1 Tax=Parachitinimonas caeni TaxID=3031301 RepID=A0ABT7DZU0_9NEIS|nr:PLP-dependent aminotransferase family protein [Parachitinimonas caeni]MDK2125586.1 PLP-dependent aminotransferase family protein [Parachitinimonas caeni]
MSVLMSTGDLGPVDARPRYEQLADTLERCIRDGLLAPGDRLPSVRALCEMHDASPATVTHALHRLEDAGLIEARPRSGFFVRRQSRNLLAPPSQCVDALTAPQRIELGPHRQLLMEFAHDQVGNTLGRARIDPGLYPVESLRKLLARQLQREPSLLTDYAFDAGDLALREQVARRAIQAGSHWLADDVLVTHGSSEGLALCLRLLTQPGEVVAIPTPTDPMWLEILNALDLRALEIPAHPCDGLSVDALTLALRQQKIAAVLVAPNFPNPTGSLMSDEAKQRLVMLTAEYGVPLIEDDQGGELGHLAVRPKPCKAFDQTGQVLLVGDLGLVVGLGLQVGYVIAGRYREALEALKHVLYEPVPRLIQRAVAAFMASGQFEPHLRRLRRGIADHLATHHALVCEHFPPACRLACAPGGYMLWIELPRHIDTAELRRRTLIEGIEFAPGALFSLGDTFRNCLRLNAGLPVTPSAEQAIRRLGQLVAASL